MEFSFGKSWLERYPERAWPQPDGANAATSSVAGWKPRLLGTPDEMLRIDQEPSRWALLPEPDVGDGLGVEVASEDGVVAQDGAEDAGVCDVHGGALANGVFEHSHELGIGGGGGVVGQGEVVASDQIGGEDDAAFVAGEGGEGAQVRDGERVADGLEKPVVFAEGLEHGELHLGDEAGGGDDVELCAEAFGEGLGGGFGVTDEIFGGELEPLPAIEEEEHAREIDGGVTVDAFAFVFWDAGEGVVEGDSVEIDQVNSSIVLEQSGELDIVAVARTQDADRAGEFARDASHELPGQVLPVTRVERGVGERAIVRQALLVHLVVEPGGHVG